jgi:hypothetical protein
MTAVTDCNTLTARLNAAHASAKSWRKVAAQFGITSGMAFRIARRGYVPKDRAIRRRLGLVTPRDLWDWPVRELARAIRERR